MPEKRSLTEATVSLFELLEPLDQEERQRAINATFALLGQSFQSQDKPSPANGSRGHREEEPIDHSLRANAEKWMRQYQISSTAIDNVYHIDGEQVTIIATQVPGKSKREKTVNCYLLTGVRSLIANDEANFSDREAVEFCQQVHAHDSANHAANRSTLGARITGSRSTGFKLTVPGLRDAAALIKSMTSGISET